MSRIIPRKLQRPGMGSVLVCRAVWGLGYKVQGLGCRLGLNLYSMGLVKPGVTGISMEFHN